MEETLTRASFNDIEYGLNSATLVEHQLLPMPMTQ